MVGNKVLGEGNFGEVRLGAVIKEGELSKAAIKTLKSEWGSPLIHSIAW